MATIVGRDLEAVAIDEFLDRAAEGPRALVIEGAAGIGKSTLWLATLAVARERGFALLGRYDPDMPVDPLAGGDLEGLVARALRRSPVSESLGRVLPVDVSVEVDLPASSAASR